MRICSLITIYKPDIEKLKQNIEIMLQYSKAIYLLFNSPVIDELLFDSGIIAVDNKKNIGISRAINKGIDIAAKDGHCYALLFDQDSCLPKDGFEKMYNEFLAEEKERPAACIGPSLAVYGNNITIPKWLRNSRQTVSASVYSVNHIITSGMLINIPVFLKLGGFNANYPVDFCDFMFCWKAVYNNYLVLQSAGTVLTHEIGFNNFKFGNITIHFHAPYRNYFLTRDTLNVSLLEKETPVYIRIRFMLHLPFRMMLFLIALKNKKDRIKMYLLGLKDFLLGKRHFGSIARMLGAE
ncbi:MAG: glycosyltransferase [Spirochaetaceae bacterium]|jgi:rhamnosyltransferase|nr:glycosyltransferase [Spirochaetaceae bacterium]